MESIRLSVQQQLNFKSALEICESQAAARLQTKLNEQQAYNRSLIEASPDAQLADRP